MFIYSSHLNGITCLTNHKNLLASGSADETVKYVPLLPFCPAQCRGCVSVCALNFATGRRCFLVGGNRIYDLKKRMEVGTLIQHNGTLSLSLSLSYAPQADVALAI